MVGGASCSVPPLCQWLVGLFFAYHLFVNGCWGFLWPATSLTIVDGASIGVPPLCKWMVGLPLAYHLFVNGWCGIPMDYHLFVNGVDSDGLPPLCQWLVGLPLAYLLFVIGWWGFLWTTTSFAMGGVASSLSMVGRAFSSPSTSLSMVVGAPVGLPPLCQ